MTSDIELTVVSPIYNEQTVVENSVQNLTTALEEMGVTWELILVNDGSTDDTQSVIAPLAEQNEHIHIIAYRKNRGRGYALRQGIAASRGRYVITTESDLSWGRDILRKLYDALRETEAGIVVASPYAPGGRLENVPFTRAFLSSMGNRILRLTVPVNITMLSGMTRGYQGEFIRSLPLEEDRKEIHLEIISKAVMLGAEFSEVPAILRWEPRQKGKPRRKSKFKANKLIRSHLLFSFNEAPILLFGTLGALLMILGFIAGCHLAFLHYIQDKIIGDRIVQIILTSFLILSGLSMFIFCFLSYQIKQLKVEMFRHAYNTRRHRIE